jgi:CDGSH-type Zn-finger protein/truncated hemoglobin YjbI
MSSGEGKLAQLIATRGGRAAPEAPFVIEHREALIYMLCEAAELEHGIMCQYLYAAFSLKQSVDEGLSEAEAEAVRRWQKQISHVAAQEMLHLALVHNMLSAIGAAPHMARPNLPAPASHYPAGVQLALLPFGEQALKHFMFLERPEGMDLDDADGLAAMEQVAPVAMSEDEIVPRAQDFATVGHLYRSIEAGFAHLCELYGEDWLFVGPPRAQATPGQFGWPELVAVTDLASAQAAIEEILEQGEGPRGEWRNAHFGQFVNILDEYQQMCASNPAFDPVRPVLVANVRSHERDTDIPLITDRLSAQVTDLFNVGYEILLQLFERYFAHTEESDGQLGVLADAAIGLMMRVIKPLGSVITLMPVGDAYPGRTAGPSFELFYETDYLMPHRDAAWTLLVERMYTAAGLCRELTASLTGQLDPVLSALREIAASLAEYLPASSPQARAAQVPPSVDVDAVLREAGALVGGSELSRAVHALIVDAASGAGCDVGQGAQIASRLTSSVLRPLAAASSPDHDRVYFSAPSAEKYTRSAGVPAADRVVELARAVTVERVRLGAGCPPELAEAVAALQDLACSVAGAECLDEFWELQAGLPASVVASPDGPYLVTNLHVLTDSLGVGSRPAPQLALCRCGNSARKPLCDGSHASSGFSGEKDPRRVPDQRDVYAGQQVTIFDNRGICQHSGLCTDRLPTVFCTDAKPFVAPSGGRMDEIIRAVRDCPSGALSYAIDGVEARDQVDWNGVRPEAIEVTKDGPYRVTGSVALAEPRAEGASAEHYALCRCGHSRNKPFCSGMHWYVGFADPVVGREPTLLEWAGGLGGLARMTRLLCEKHIPSDPLLAAAFADMPPDGALRLAHWLAAALGGPVPVVALGEANLVPGSGGYGAEQQSRWLGLAATAADEAGLPADASFRAVLSSCLEWGVRAAAAGSTQPTPVWGWGVAGPPVVAASAQEESEVVLPGPDETVSFAAHIKPLFRESDRKSMSFAFDLWSLEAVRTQGPEILERLRDGTMPCDGAWPQEKIEVFGRWLETGTQP